MMAWPICPNKGALVMKWVPIKTVLWIILAGLLTVAALAAQQQSTPGNDDKDKTKVSSPEADAETKKVVETSCGSCHGMDVVASAQKNKEEWTQVVRDMISYGASLKEAQIPEVADYLSRSYAPKK